MRVYELAKQLGMENRDLIPELKKLGVAVASHSSALDEDMVKKVLEKFGGKARGEGSAGPKTKKDAAHEGGHAPKAGHAKAQPVEEPVKPDKRRILIKKKKEDESDESVVTPPGDLSSAMATVMIRLVGTRAT